MSQTRDRILGNMLIRIFIVWVCAIPTAVAAQTIDAGFSGAVSVTDRARRIHFDSILVDGHNDLPWALRSRGMPSFSQFDLAQQQPALHTDIPRLRRGGVGAQFWSVYVPAETAYDGTALMKTLQQIELVTRMVQHYSDTFAMAYNTDDIRRITSEGRIASMIGVEGGHAIEDSLNVLRQLYELGARYMTLTHSDNLKWADSATDEQEHGGLTAFGEEVVREMNRLGMLVDLSHVSASTMKHALRMTKAPVIFSHSSARAVTDNPRNVPDDVLRDTARNGGVVMVNYYSGFVVPASAQRYRDRRDYREKLLAEGRSKEDVESELKRWDRANPVMRGTIHDVISHIDHIAKVAGVDHVGLGSDFDGVDSLPTQLEDVSTYPRITQLLLERGYSETDIRKILGENLLRALRVAERIAAAMQRPK